MPRDEPPLTGYFSVVPKLLFFSLLCLPLTLFSAECIELQDGTKIDGTILSVTTDAVLIEVQTSPTIREEKSYPRTEVVKIQRASQDDMAFAEIAEITVPATADSPEVYDALLEQKVRPFMQNYAYSKHMPEARKLSATLEAERARVAAGEVKVARETLQKLRGALARSRADLEHRTREQSKLVDSEETRLDKIDVETLASGVAAAREAKEQLDAGQLDAAKQSLERAEKLWSQHVLLASLKESLKKAQAEAAKQATPDSKPAKS